jgi:hypothetical protein
VDDRAAFESAIEASGGMRPGNYSPDYDRYVSERRQGQYEGWKLARAALSPPSHGEQVCVVPVEPTEAMRKAAQDKLASEGLIVTDWLIHTAYSALLAAAPSAGSQEQE